MATFPGSPPNPLGFKAELNLNGTWTDITLYVMLRDVVTISNMGRTDESGQISASQLTLTLKNDGRFTPKNTSSPYYPNLTRNTQIRISVNATSATGVAYNQFRFFGEVSSWPPGFDISQRDVYVQITASGIWRRIQAASVNIGSSYTRYVKLLTGTGVPQAYWSMEDGSNTTGFVLTEGTATNVGITSPPSFSADGTSFPGSDALPTCNGSRMRGNPSGGTATNNVIRFALSIPAAGDSGLTSGSATVMNCGTAGTVATVNVTVDTTWKLTITGKNSGGTTQFSVQLNQALNGIPVLVSVELTPSGGNVAWKLQVIKPGAGSALASTSGTVTTATIGQVSFITLNGNGILQDTTLGQLGLWYASVPTITNDAGALGGHSGETAVARFQRLCTESNIASTVIGSSSATMGPQVDDTLANIFQGIEDTDGGMLYETRDQFGLGYRTLASMQNQAASVTMAYTSGALGEPPQPTYDDQLIRNQVTVTNYDGYSALAICTSGAMSVQAPPNGVGAGYSSSLSINASSDTQANTIAQQKLFQGCVDDVRFPVLTVNFQRTAAAPFFSSVPSLRLGDRMDLTSLPAFLGGGSSKQLIWGYTETMGGTPEGWTIKFNTVPEAPFETTFSPGVFSVTQAPAGSVAAGSAVGSSVSGSQIAGQGIPAAALAGTLVARSVGGITQFISAATPYNWTFAVSGTPSDATYFICTQAQAQNIVVGDTFTNNGSHGGPFTVTQVNAVSGGNTNVYFTPDATSVMSTGTVFGGKNGDTWVNTSGGNQVNQWQAGAWNPITWNASNVIQANTITASQIAAGIVIAGVVDGTVIQGATIIADGTSGEFLVYSGTPTTGNLIGSWSGASGSDGHSNSYPAGLAVEQGGLVLLNQTGSAPAAVSGASTLYSSSLGRMRYLASSGADMVMERSACNQGNVTIAHPTTMTLFSGALNYIAGEAQLGMEFELEIDGTLTTPSVTAVGFTFQLDVDAALFGGQFGIGSVMLQPARTYAFHVRWAMGVTTTGAAGKVDVYTSGGIVDMTSGFNYGNLETGGGMSGSPVSRIDTNLSFDTTANHTIAAYGAWGGTPTSGSGIVYRTKIARRN